MASAFAFASASMGVTICDNLLITLDLIWCLHAEFSQKLVKMLLIDNDLSRRQRLEFTISVDVLLAIRISIPRSLR